MRLWLHECQHRRLFSAIETMERNKYIVRLACGRFEMQPSIIDECWKEGNQRKNANGNSAAMNPQK